MIMACIAIAGMCTSVSTAAQLPGAGWAYFHFDGSSFKPGLPETGAFVAVRNHALPVVLTQPSQPVDTQLPAGMGAIAGISFIQTRGGKLTAGNGYLPCPGVDVTVSSRDVPVMTVKTDSNGYFLAVLKTGAYRIGSAPLTQEVTVENGKTTLIALRTGKRMVD
jgi:hypothetical protein